MKKLLLIFVMLFSLLNYGQEIKGKIVKVKDGDTVVLLDSLNTMYTIRLGGIDCPEKNQDFGSSAKKFTSDAIYGKIVKFVKINTDQWGRKIGWVYYGDNFSLNLSEELLKNGLAWHYKKYDKSKKLDGLEQEVRNQKIGIWSKENPIFPEEFRKTKKSAKR